MSELNSFLKGIADAIRSKKGTTDKINASDFASEIAGITGGSGGSSEIIEVYTLPTKNIDSNSVYKLKQFNSLIVNDGESIFSLSNRVGITGYETFEVKPTGDIIESDLSGFPMLAHLYYILDENDVFVFTNMGFGASWVSLGSLFEHMLGSPLEFKGECLRNEGIKEIGYYVMTDIRYYVTENNNFIEIGGANTLFQRLLDYEVSDIYGNPMNFTDKLDLTSSVVNLPNLFQYLNCNYIKIDFISDYLGGSTPNNTTRVAELHSAVFENCTAKTIYLTSKLEGTSFGITGNGPFRECYYLENLILDFEIIESFNYDLEIEETTTIYVRDNLVDTVKSLTGWSNYSSQIKPLSEYVA